MNLVWAALITIAVTAVAVTAMLLVRRRAPDGGYFADGDRAAGVFGVLATAFSVLLGFVVFLAFTRYDDSRAGAQAEAITVVQMFETAQLLPQDGGSELSGELLCYGRSVVNLEWPRMESGSSSNSFNPWAVELFRTLQTIEPVSASEQSAFDAWLAQSDARYEARRDRLHAAEGIVPLSVWVVLFLSAGVVVVYMTFFADSGERAIVQAVMMGSVTTIIVASLLTLAALNNPYSENPGGLRPVAMTRTLETLQQARQVLELNDPIPCDAAGRPT
jgi:phosphatidylglycerophosphate synthase